MSGVEGGELIRTGIDNSKEFERVLNGDCQDAKTLLERDTVLRVRDCQVNNVAQQFWLDFKYDIDGIVGTFKHFSDILTSYSYLGVLPRQRQSLISVFNILRKHLQLQNYTKEGNQYLRWSVSTKITDGDGFDFHLSLLPKEGRICFQRYTRQELENLQYDFYEQFRNNLSTIIQEQPLNELSRATIKKTSILDIRTIHVLPDDRSFILKLCDEALERTLAVRNFEATVIAFRLGDRDSSGEVCLKAFNSSAATVSVHCALTISSPTLRQHIFWSRFGLQPLIGQRGSLLTALSLSSCGNFVSNLDGRCIDISGELRSVCRRPEKVTFIQFYADTPHLSKDFIHPVFGSIVSSGVLHPAALQALDRRSEQYISVAKENQLKLNVVNARVEVVCITNGSQHLRADNYINVHALQTLIAKYPLLVPFANSTPGNDWFCFSDVLRSVPKHINESLETLFSQQKRKGGFLSAWNAYQLEVANELFWRGKLNAPFETQYAINLGPGGSKPSRSITWERGFLCLEDATSCALDDRSIPPLNFWHLKDVDKARIQRIFNFIDFVHGGVNVVGTRALLILLRDVVADPSRRVSCERSFLADLRRKTPPSQGQVTGVTTADSLSEKLCRSKYYRSPYVFGRVLTLIEEEGLSARDVVCAGVESLKLKFFPDLRFFDASRNPRVNWSGLGFLRITSNRQDVSLEALAIELSRDVIGYLEDCNLVFKSKFLSQHENPDSFVLPWVVDILERLSDSSFDRQELIEVMAYLSCIALMQNNWYMPYRKFQLLHCRVHETRPGLTQMLQCREILSVFRLTLVNHFNVKRLHETLPIAFEERKNCNHTEAEQQEKDNSEEESTMEVDSVDCEFVDEIPDQIDKPERKHHPAGLRHCWTPVELEILETISRLQLGLFDAYKAYQKMCEEHSIPDRSKKAFVMKFKRLKEITS